MKSRILLLCAVVIWGWTFVATKVVVGELGPLEIFGLRLALGVPVLGIVLLLKRVPLRLTRTDVRPLFLAGVILTAHFLVQIAGLELTTASNSAWIIAASPLALAVFSFFLLHERIGWWGVGGILIATSGILLLVSRGHLADLTWLERTGDWLVLVSAGTWALYTIAIRDLARRRNPLTVSFAILLIAAALVAVPFFVAADWAAIRGLSGRGLVALFYLAIPGLALGQWFWQEGVAELGAAHAGLYLYIEPLAAVALAVPLLGEPFGPLTALGGGLVLAGVYLGQRGQPRITRPPPEMVSSTKTPT